MNSILSIYKTNKSALEGKSLSQVLAFTGDGKLKDKSKTSLDFREFLTEIPSELIIKFTDNCLKNGFPDSGLALQDVVNEIGSRLSFQVKHGLYRGNQNLIGYDGIWTTKQGHSIILEVKTTDTYRINLDTIATYRTKLADLDEISHQESSILIVVGREDTGDLEAQIRGSRHAWDIRLLSIDSLIKLLVLKENLNDNKTIQQITELLKPREYTRIDRLIDLIFQTSQDFDLVGQVEPDEVDDLPEPEPKIINEDSGHSKTVPVSFHQECLEKIEKKLSVSFIKQSRISYSTKDKNIGLVIAVSKPHKHGKFVKYWFAFHPYQEDYLKDFPDAYIAFGCGDSDKILLIPIREFEPLIKNFWITEKSNGRMYWHIIIHERDKKFTLAQPKNEVANVIDITKYKVYSF